MAFEKLWRLEEVSENRKKANVIPINKLLKKDPGNYRPITLISGSAMFQGTNPPEGYHKADEACEWEKPGQNHHRQI